MKSGVVTAKITFNLFTNLFGSEDSWRLSLTDYTDYTDLIFLITSTFFSHRLHRFDFLLVSSAVMSHMRHKSYLSGESYQGANDSWLWMKNDIFFSSFILFFSFSLFLFVYLIFSLFLCVFSALGVKKCANLSKLRNYLLFNQFLDDPVTLP